MNTAKTLQLLDANNNNISPATCVDSLYFEKVHTDGNTYRMALKNRIIVAGDNMNTTSTISDNPTDLNQITIPYFYVSPASGTGNIYQLQTTTLKIGQAISNAFLNSSSNYITRTYGNEHYLKLDGTNYMTGPLKVGSGASETKIQNNKITFGSNSNFIINANTSTNSFIMNASSGINYFAVDASVINIGTNFRVNNLTSTVNIADSSTSTVNIKPWDSFNVSSGYIDIASRNNTSIGSYVNTEIYAQTGDINIHTKTSSKNVNIDASTISLYNTALQNPQTLSSERDNKYVLYFDTDSRAMMTWSSLPILNIASYGSATTTHTYMNDLSVDTSIYFKRLCFTHNLKPEYKDTLMINNYDESIVYIRGIQDQNGRTMKMTGNSSNDTIKIATINGQSLLDDTTMKNFELLTKKDVSIYNSTYCAVATGDNNNFRIFGNESPSSHPAGTSGEANNTSIGLKYIDSIYYRTNGAVYASAFYATSDERLKTDIQSVNVDSIPEIKKFAWKDSSVYTYGFIAQELEKQGYTELVDTDDNGFKKVNYDAALSLTVATLQKENKDLKKRLEKIEKLLADKL